MPLFTDDFNRADENPLAGNWTTQGGGFGDLQIVSNVLKGVSGSNNAAYVNSVTPNNDQYAQLVILSATPSGGGPCVRMSTGANTMYGLQVYAGPTFDLFRFSAGSYTQLDTAGGSHSAGDTYKITVEGTSIKGYQNGVEILSATDANLTGGRAGVYVFQNDRTFDSFECGNMAAAFQAAWARNSNQVIIA